MPAPPPSDDRVPNWGAVWNAAKTRSGLHPMSIHGPGHWKAVERNGIALAGATPGADAALVRLFAVLHDCKRRTESTEPEHGPRAAAFARSLNGVLFTLSEDDLSLLAFACERHEFGHVSEDPTVGCCWDADRLDLPRVGVVPEAGYMSTAAGRAACE